MKSRKGGVEKNHKEMGELEDHCKVGMMQAELTIGSNGHGRRHVMLKALGISMAAVILIGIAPPAVANCQPAHSQACQNMRSAKTVYDRQRAAQQRAAQQRYLQENDRRNGVSQRTGVTGGRTSDGKGGWVGYQKSIR